jgi:ABC-2 type transport system ATP-binding protein
VFLDEPTEGLDPRSRSAIWDTLTELRRRLGVTLVLTTHDMDEAEALCDRIGIVDRGSLVVEGTPDSLTSAGAPTLEAAYLHYTEREAA